MARSEGSGGSQHVCITHSFVINPPVNLHYHALLRSKATPTFAERDETYNWASEEAIHMYLAGIDLYHQWTLTSTAQKGTRAERIPCVRLFIGRLFIGRLGSAYLVPYVPKQPARVACQVACETSALAPTMSVDASALSKSEADPAIRDQSEKQQASNKPAASCL
ncbi:hypothetical protein PG994_013890 [Apiospora phragmitis]|uniref:Uncharacterized protein n=1 Tax=Apiospora phragmitis TaxID=2905665 RepID=A0ABR1T2S1_9PEZI